MWFSHTFEHRNQQVSDTKCTRSSIHKYQLDIDHLGAFVVLFFSLPNISDFSHGPANMRSPVTVPMRVPPSRSQTHRNAAVGWWRGELGRGGGLFSNISDKEQLHSAAQANATIHPARPVLCLTGQAHTG